MIDTHTTAQIPDEAVQAAVKAYSKQMDYNDNHDDAVKAALTSAIPYLSAPCAVEVPTKEERHANTARNLIINQTSADLEDIVNGHDPEQSILKNDVWDRLDKMACEIEALTKPVDVAAVLEALEIIANPIKHFEESAKKAGDHLDGHTAIALSSDANWLKGIAQKALDTIRALSSEPAQGERKYKLGDRLTKTRGSKWTGRVVGFYSTNLTPIGYAIESETETGSVQIYPEAALTAAPTTEEGK